MEVLPHAVLAVLVGGLVLVLALRRSAPPAVMPLPPMPDLRRVPYAGFWKRLPALVVDALVIVPLILLARHLESGSWHVSVALVVPVGAMGMVYEVYFHGRWGATIGKMVMRIRVVRADGGSDILYREALLRSSVSIAFAILTMAADLSMLLAVSPAEYESLTALDLTARASRLAGLRPGWQELVTYAYSCWFWSEVIVMLLNRQRQALHDMIAGTIVVCAPKTPEIRRIVGPAGNSG